MPFRVTASFVIAIMLACAGGVGPSELANPPAAAVISSGANQVRFPGTPLRSVLVVQLVDAAGEPTAVSGLPVVWRVVEGDGEVSGADTTDAHGVARAGFVLGDEVGTHTVEVGVADLEPVRVSARAVHPGPILFVSNRRAGFKGDAVAGFPGDLYVMNDDGSDVILLALSNLPVEYTSHPAWKRDGTEILFNRVEPRPAGGIAGAVPLGVFAAYPTGHDRRKIPVGSEPQFAVNLREARWSPDGRTIVAHRSDTDRLYTFGPTGTDFQEVPTSGAARSADWSPSGDRFVYVCGGGICVADRDGENSVRLTSAASDIDPVWSPDGTQILFARDTSESGGIWLMSADGSNARRVLEGAASGPAWAPDGTRFAASIRTDGGADIWVTDVATGESVNITESGWIDREPSWRWDARRGG